MKPNSWTAPWIAETLNLPLSPEFSETRFSAIVTDSRKIMPGCLFVALPGEKFDGHDFIDSALKQGAQGVVAQSDRLPSTPPTGVLFLPVRDTLEAYRKLGKAWRARHLIPVAMVAGSNGKTTTKELLSALFQGKWERILKTQGSQNGFVGIPLTLLELTSEHQAAVIEVGIDEPGTMKGHVDVVAPTTAVLTVVEPEHLEKLIDLDTVAREEGYALSETARLSGAVAINCDDPRILPHFSTIRSRSKLGYTMNPADADSEKLHGRIQESPSDSSPWGELEVQGPGWNEPQRFSLPLPGRHNAMNLLAAIAVAKLVGLSADEMRKGLARFAPPEGRSQVKALSDGTQVICDYYNSQPASLKAGLELLKQISDSTNSPSRWACLADMLELGPNEETFHREPAAWIEQLGIENVALFGKRMRWLEDELKKRGHPGTLRHFESQTELAETLAREARAGSTILIKGSNSMKMGEVWKILEQSRR